MNISGVTQTAQILPPNQTVPQPPEVQDTRSQGSSQEAVSPEAINLSVAVSVQVMDMALSSFEDAANKLIEEMAAATGVGQTVNTLA